MSTKKQTLICILLCTILWTLGCSIGLTAPPEGAFAGRAGEYDYSPTAIQTGNVQQIWWCGEVGSTDTIQYESIDLTTHMVVTGPQTVLKASHGKWDSVFICNPKVVRGVFKNPFGDSHDYSYAMYYVGTSSPTGLSNDIGVAFSNDGIDWRKYPHPVIVATTRTNYGVGQPAVYNSDHKSAILLFYEDLNSPRKTDHIEAKSTDGIHFTTVGTLTTKGIDPNFPESSWGDMAFDSATGYWYAAFNLPCRDPATVGNASERGQLGVVLYRIPDDSLISGTTPWQQLKSFDTNAMGNESTFIAGFTRDDYGALNVGAYPTIEMFTSISNPRPAWNSTAEAAGKSDSTDKWDIGVASWVPGAPSIPLNRYANTTTHVVTTGWIDPNGGFGLESTLGHLYESPQMGATVAFYGCKSGPTDYFVSTDVACGGKLFLGTNGFGYSGPDTNLGLLPLYSCNTDHDHFLSKDSHCEGQQGGQLLGYVMP